MYIQMKLLDGPIQLGNRGKWGISVTIVQHSYSLTGTETMIACRSVRKSYFGTAQGHRNKSGTEISQHRTDVRNFAPLVIKVE